MNTYRLIQGDCLNVLPTLEDESINLVVTDPPYGISFRSNYRTKKFDMMFGDNNLEWVGPSINEIYRVLKNNSAFFCFTRWDVYPYWYNIISKKFNIKNCLIIKRKHTSMGDLFGSFAFSYEMCIFALKGRREYNKLQRVNLKRVDKRTRNQTGYRYRFPDLITFIDANVFNLNLIHPTQKSLEINEFFIDLYSNLNDIILDPFSGSGTTIMACQNLRRSCIGIEIDPKYCDITKDRCFGRTFLDREVGYKFEINAGDS